jgi:hypothetical protein
VQALKDVSLTIPVGTGYFIIESMPKVEHRLKQVAMVVLFPPDHTLTRYRMGFIKI